MILLCDVGNTQITFGFSDGINILSTFRLNTNLDKTSDQYYIELNHFLSDKNIKSVAIASVVPQITNKLIELSNTYLKIDPFIMTIGVKTGVNIKTDNPKEVGADLICAAAGINDKKAVIIDLGTAIKYIYVKNRTILGVVITPGVNISIKALVGNTALLPDIDIITPKKVLGTNTIHCMQSGVTYGVAAEIEGLISRIKAEVNEDFDICLTGGLSELIKPLLNIESSLNKDLVLEGLLAIYNRNK